MRVSVLPETMLAYDPAEAGGPEVLVPVTRPVPRPKPGECLIKVAAAGINRPEILQRQGAYPPPPGAPSILGLECAGRVVAVGEGVDSALLGQPMCALVSGGAYAEYCAAPVGQCLPVPEALSLIEAAALPETLFTVWHNLFERAYTIEGDAVLVHGGTSGIGVMAILLGRLFELRVIVTCGSDEKCHKALTLGATHAINYRTTDFVEEVKRLTDGRGVSAVLDMVSGDYVARNLRCLAEDGRHVTIAQLGGNRAEIDMGLVMRRRLTLTGSTLRARDATFKALLADEIAREVWPMVADGRLKPVIDKVFPFAEAAAAHRRMEAGDHVGKIVLALEG
ncbi:NAD(P)H-quinone oxidoreductase [Sphingomonas morindae]|uniref:NAD(P)H-quinone oxidoreductase n=1 Tax=Sphingomonas morindae TaxID=1541170 RepID=A0ABY4X7L5_9SPHN|nr:NAD(P)H-quinone oxidoreductase [Sphingomonas morindae]USI72928.1 NAD(P)H-quinone oxidoreductase [Sphingomonas morindae]